MNVKEFDSLERKDFDNGAILDEIRIALKQRDDLRAALEDLEQTLALLLPNVKDNHVSVSVDEAALRRKLQQARAALAGERGGEAGDG